MSEVKGAGEAYLNRLRESRSSIAVSKYRIANLRSQLPHIPIFAFEGNDDKIIYYHWIKRIRPDLEYEPFPCSGKRQVFALRAMVHRDLNNLKDNIYYFVDRDFDDMNGNPLDEKTFMTDFYATENYLVCRTVLNEFLRNEFHCHARPDIRDKIIAAFEELYERFLDVTQDINFRLFAAKKYNIPLTTHVPNRAIDVAVITLDAVTKHSCSSKEIIGLQRELTDLEMRNARSEFDELDRRERYRGKFAFYFFEKWLTLLAESAARNNATFFRDLEPRQKVNQSEIVLGNFASKSPYPRELPAFIIKLDRE